MTTEQIIKALECCGSEQKLCRNCPYNCGTRYCMVVVREDALALIKNQLGEIRGLNSAIETLQGVAKDYENRNENLKKENKYLRESLADEREHKEDCFFSVDFDIKALKTDTVKRMQELIKERCIEGGIYPAFVASTIDKIAKEILEGKDGI